MADDLGWAEGERCARIVRDAFESLFGLERGPTTLTAAAVDGSRYVEILKDCYFHSPGAAAVGLLSALAAFHWGRRLSGSPKVVYWRVEPEIAKVEGLSAAVDGAADDLWRVYARLALS